jgi:hypothetical protein
MTLNNQGFEDVAINNVNTDIRQTQKLSFVNNNSTATIAGKVVNEKQALSKVLKPKADN